MLQISSCPDLEYLEAWNVLLLFRDCLRFLMLWYKQIGLKKWLTAIEAPIKDLPVCDTLAKTMGLKVFLLESLLKWYFAAVITRLAWSVLPLSLRSSIMSLNWNLNRNKEPLTVTFLSASTVIFINFRHQVVYEQTWFSRRSKCWSVALTWPSKNQTICSLISLKWCE